MKMISRSSHIGEKKEHKPATTYHPVTLCIVGGLMFLVGACAGFFGSAAQGRIAHFLIPIPSIRTIMGATSSTDFVIDIGRMPVPAVEGDVDLSLFWEVWQDIHRNYYQQPVDDQQLLYGAIQGMTDAVGDPYTMYFPPTDAKEFEEGMKGEFSGIGAEIGMKDGALQIIAPLPETPAERANVQAGDLILKIDGEESLTMPVAEAVSKIRGPMGTEVVLLLGRPANPPKKDANGYPVIDTREVRIVRDTIVVKSASMTDEGDGIFAIELRSFNEDAAGTFRALVDEALAKGAQGFVIDVRNDPGGYLDRAVEIAGEWLNGEVVVEQRERGVVTNRIFGDGRGKLRGVPTAVLVNEGSASASEILAGALQDYGVATVIGTQTFGKGSVQNLIEYGDGSAMKITISEWLTPKGRSIDQEGIAPDVEVVPLPEDIHDKRDRQLEKAVEILRAR